MNRPLTGTVNHDAGFGMRSRSGYRRIGVKPAPHANTHRAVFGSERVMRIRKIKVNNFKSLVDFEMTFEKFTCLVGLNGSGKSTVLQFLDFLSQLIYGEVRAWLKERIWKPIDLVAWRQTNTLITFSVEMSNDNGEPIGEWKGEFNPTSMRCDTEKCTIGGQIIEVIGERIIFEYLETKADIPKEFARIIDYQGSIFSKLRHDFLAQPLIEFREFFLNSRTLELLSPRLMRQRTRGPSSLIGRGGERLSAYLYDLPEDQRTAIEKRLREAYPQFRTLSMRAGKSGGKVLEVNEEYIDREFRTEARQVNDGFLRLLAIITNLESESQLLVFDEIENGVNTELVSFLVATLTKSRQQVVVTTHSPLIMNYLTDDDAKQSMVYLYKTSDGISRAIRFFDIPSMAKKLKVMGPGEVFADTNLVQLTEEILAITEPV